MKKVSKQVARQISKEMAKEYESPFKVLNWLNSHRNVVINQDGETVQNLFENIGVNGKLKLDDLCNIVEGSYKAICTLQKTDVLFVPYFEKRFYVTIGNTTYIKVPVVYSVASFIDSLNAQIRIQQDREKKMAMYERLFEKIYEKEAKIRNKAQKNTLSKERANRKKAILSLVKSLRAIPVYSKSTGSTIYRAAIRMYDSKKAA